jgi:hypothetical protein
MTTSDDADAATARAGDVLEIAVGVRGAVPVGPPAASIDALASAGLGVYLALRVIEGHGGSMLVVPTVTAPRVLVRLPR